MSDISKMVNSDMYVNLADLKETPAQAKAREQAKLKGSQPRIPEREWKKIVKIVDKIRDMFQGKEGTPQVYMEIMRRCQDSFDKAGYLASIRFYWATDSMPEPKLVTALTNFPTFEPVMVIPQISLDIDNPDKKLELTEETIYEREHARDRGESYWEHRRMDVLAKSDVIKSPEEVAKKALKKGGKS